MRNYIKKLIQGNIKRYTIYIKHKYTFLHKLFSKLIVPTHFSMVVCVQTVKDARGKVKIRDELMSQKRSDLQKDYYCSRSN